MNIIQRLFDYMENKFNQPKVENSEFIGQLLDRTSEVDNFRVEDIK